MNKFYWATCTLFLFLLFRFPSGWGQIFVVPSDLAFLSDHAQWALAEVWIYEQHNRVGDATRYPLVSNPDEEAFAHLASFWHFAVKGDCSTAAAIAAEISVDKRDPVRFLIGNCWHQVGQSNEAAEVWRQIAHVDRYFLRQALACRELDDLVCEDDYYQLAAAALSHADWRTTWQLLNHFRLPASAGIPQQMLVNLRSLPDAPPEMIAYVEAEILFSQGQTAAAVQRYSEVIAAQPPLFRVYVDAGRAAQAYGDHELARAYWQQGLLLAPERATLYRLIANSHYQQGDWEEAFVWYEQIPDDNQSITRRGDIRFNQERYAEAVLFYQQTLTVQHDPRLVGQIARSYLALGDLVQARRKLELAIDWDIERDQESLYLLLATICEQMNDIECASNAYNAVLEQSPDNVAVQRRLQALTAPETP